MDMLCINALSVATKIGVHAWEQRINQQLLIDITIPLDFSACQENLNNTIDYDALCHSVTHYVESQSFQLIETVANKVAQLIQQQFKVKSLTLSVTKPHAVKNAGVIKVVVTR
ncbi:MAG: dihydroneopterin aldolase [bacterium]|nr:dihydroneopterin aldolase [bacterium]